MMDTIFQDLPFQDLPIPLIISIIGIILIIIWFFIEKKTFYEPEYDYNTPHKITQKIPFIHWIIRVGKFLAHFSNKAITLLQKLIKPSIKLNLKIEVEKDRVKPGGRSKLTLKCYDDSGQEINLNDNDVYGDVKWFCDDGDEHLSPDYVEKKTTRIFVGSKSSQKRVKITAKLNRNTDSVIIEIESVLDKIEITSPDIDNHEKIDNDKKIKFTAKGYDQFGEKFEIDRVTWTADKGRIDKYNGDYSALGVAHNTQVIITATHEKEPHIKQSRKFSIHEPSRLTKLRIEEPKFVELKPKSPYQFKVIALDQRDQEMHEVENIIWTAPEHPNFIDQKSGKIHVDENYKGRFQVIVKVGNLTDEATIDVPPVLKRLEILPKETELDPEQEYQFTAQGYDQKNDVIAVNNIQWKSSAGGKIDSAGVFVGYYEKRKVTVTATVNDLEPTDALISMRPVLRQLIIDPPSVSIQPRKTINFTLEGRDQFGEKIDPGSVEWDTDGGEIDKNGCFTASDNKIGSFKVTATSPTSLQYTATGRIEAEFTEHKNEDELIEDELIAIKREDEDDDEWTGYEREGFEDRSSDDEFLDEWIIRSQLFYDFCPYNTWVEIKNKNDILFGFHHDNLYDDYLEYMQYKDLYDFLKDNL